MYTDTSEVLLLPSMLCVVVFITNNTTVIHRPVTNFTLTYNSPFTKIPHYNDKQITVYPYNWNECLTLDLTECLGDADEEKSAICCYETVANTQTQY
jgi:hypothetical protein